MKKTTTVFFILVVSVLLTMMIACGDSGTTRKEGELYGKCYPNETCNEGLECDTEYNTCIKAKSSESEETADADADTVDAETSDIDSTATADTENTDIVDADEILSDDDADTGEINRDECNPYGREFKCINGNSYYCDYEEDKGYFWLEFETCIFFECDNSTGLCGCRNYGQLRCDEDNLRICSYSDGWEKIKAECKGGCDQTRQECKPWKDPDSGLMWSMRSSLMDWSMTADYCSKLSEGGFTDWRAPSINELRTLIKGCPYAEPGAYCGVRDNCLSSGCWNFKCILYEETDSYTKLDDGHAGWHLWSASEISDNANYAWGIDLILGGVRNEYKNENGFIRCVRGENHRQLCEGLPEHAIWNSVPSIFSTWDGTSWQPSLTGTYNETSSETECRFKCPEAYEWDGSKCRVKDSFPECSSESPTPCKDSSSGFVWSSKSDQKRYWLEAISYCEELSEGGSSDWTLPTIDELMTLVQNCPNIGPDSGCKLSEKNGFLSENDAATCSCSGSGVVYSKFGETGAFWSSSIFVFDFSTTLHPWGFLFMDDGVLPYNGISDSNAYNVRCIMKQN